MRVFALGAAILLLSLAVSASDGWWDSGWHYRIRADVNASGFDRSDWIVEQRVDFSQALGSLSAGKRLDPNSIRVIEYRNGIAGAEAISQFDRDSPDSWSGELLWQVSGEFVRNSNRTFYVYFDVLENGEKAAPGYEDGVIVESREQDLRIDSAQFMLYMDRTLYGYTHVMKKSYDWQDVATPAAHDPLANSRENVSRYRGGVSLIGDHSCDPGCAWSAKSNLSDQVVHQGPLRAALRTYYNSLERDEDNSTLAFSGSRTMYIYAGKPYYRERRELDFGQFPLNVSGVNRRTWILSGRSMTYAYESRNGEVMEGPFPVGGAEYSDWSGTWSDALGSDGSGIADFELIAPKDPRSLWIERDTNGPYNYLSALWRPQAEVSEDAESDFIYYFHEGNWRASDLPTHYWELKLPPVVELGNLSDFALLLRVPSIILNWEPTVRVEREVKGSNITITNMSCRMYSEDRKLTIFEGPVGDAGVSVFDVPEGRWKISCVAYDQHGHTATDVAQTQVYDVMTLVKICGATLLLAFLLTAALLYRVSRSMRRKGKMVDCPRCGMPIEAGGRECPVCGRKL